MPRKHIARDQQTPLAVVADNTTLSPDIEQSSAPDDAVAYRTADFPIVGIGASAGGLAAFEAFSSRK